MIKCAFTGHRPQSLPFRFNETDERCISLKQKLRTEIVRMIEDEGADYFISGMAIGIDMYAAEIVLDLKDANYPDIKLECAVPCESQQEKWAKALQERYAANVAKCDKRTLLQKEYTPGCMEKRNRYMVDQADALIAVWDGRPSGTGKTIRYAMEKNKPIHVIHPINLSVRKIPEDCL